MAKNNPLAPVVGDDQGNLVKAGYKPTELARAKKLYEREVKERPLEMGDTSFSEFLYEQACLNFVISQGEIETE